MKNKNWSRGKLDILYNKDKKTLQEIGDLYGVSRERIRQVMEEFGLARGSNRSTSERRRDKRVYRTLEEFLGRPDDRQTLTTPAFYKLIRNLHCSECGRAKNIHIHHIIYPAIKLEDIQILCASCHYAKHRRGITYMKQIDIYNQYMAGETTIELAGKYQVNPNLIYAILRKIRNGNASLKGENHLGKMSRQPNNALVLRLDKQGYKRVYLKKKQGLWGRLWQSTRKHLT